MTQSNDIAVLCPECGLPTVAQEATGGLCPGCLIAATVENLSTVDHPALARMGAIASGPDVQRLGERLPQFEFLELLGRGGAGWVFLARQRSLDRLVAVKFLDGRSAGRDDAARRFEREAQILARLKHPRIVTVHDFGTIDDCPYLVMEYVAGPTLREILRRGPLDYGDCLRITRQMSEAVRYAHKMGVLHRDLKPENVLFDSYERIDSLQVADFGISRLLGDTEPGFHLTQTGFVVGTPFYAAPEQMSSAARVDERTDVFSIGVMMYEMLTGELPRGRFPAPSHFGKATPAVDRVVLHCLESDPARRYASVAAFSEELDRAASAKPPRKSTRLELMVAAVICAASVAAFLLSRGGGDLNSNESAQGTVTPIAEGHRIPQPIAQPNSQPIAKPENVPVSPPASRMVGVDQGTQPDAGTPTETTYIAVPSPQVDKPAESNPSNTEIVVSNVTIRSDHRPYITLRIDCRIAKPDFALSEGGTLHWVIRTADGRRVSSTLPLATNRREFTIDEQVFLRITDRWPVEVGLEEEWHSPSRGSRRVSNVVRVEDPLLHGFRW